MYQIYLLSLALSALAIRISLMTEYIHLRVLVQASVKLKRKTTPDDIRVTEQKLGYALPEGLRQLFLEHGGARRPW